MCEVGRWPRPPLIEIPANLKAHRIGSQAYTHLVIEVLMEQYELAYGAPFGDVPNIEPH